MTLVPGRNPASRRWPDWPRSEAVAAHERWILTAKDTSMFKLYADDQLIGEFHSMTAAANKVARMEDDEEWPEGDDAVVVDSRGTRYMLVDDDSWELMG